MARASKLTPEQWSEVERRLPVEGASKLGREFGVSESAIRKKFGSHQTVGAQSAKVREVAHSLAQAHNALAELPTHQRYAAVSLAEKLRSISDNLAGAAEIGARTARRLKELAHHEVENMNGAIDVDTLKGVAALTRIANESASTGLALLGANKELTAKAIAPEGQTDGKAEELSDDALAVIATSGGR